MLFTFFPGDEILVVLSDKRLKYDEGYFKYLRVNFYQFICAVRIYIDYRSIGTQRSSCLSFSKYRLLSIYQVEIYTISLLFSRGKPFFYTAYTV
jgi:hypothetical protein